MYSALVYEPTLIEYIFLFSVTIPLIFSLIYLGYVMEEAEKREKEWLKNTKNE